MILFSIPVLAPLFASGGLVSTRAAAQMARR